MICWNWTRISHLSFILAPIIKSFLAKKNMNIWLNNNSLPTSNICKSLGLIRNSKLRLTEQVTLKILLAYSNLKLIYLFKNLLPQQTRKLLCDTLILSHFNHCNSVYYPCLNAFDKYRIQKLQNACLNTNANFNFS